MKGINDHFANMRTLLLIVSTLITFHIGHAQGKNEQYRTRLRMNYYKNMDGNIQLKGNAYYKRGNQKEYCKSSTVKIYTDEDLTNTYKELTVDESGFATMDLKEEDLQAFKDSSGRYNFYAILEESDSFKEADAEITVLDASINIEFLEEDSQTYLQAQILCFDPDSMRMVPGKKKALKSYVKRSLSLYPIGGDFNYTDNEGKIKFPFPDDLLGDENGFLTVLVKLDEDDEYATVEASTRVKLGKPYTDFVHTSRAPLIGKSSEAPLFLLLGINGILILVWGFLIYIVFNIFRIKRIGRSIPD